MDELNIRPGEVTDFTQCLGLDHSCQTNRIWQLDYNNRENQIQVRFQAVRLPAALKVTYPYSHEEQVRRWYEADYFQVAELDGQVYGYVTLKMDALETAVWLNDVVVSPEWRRKGYGSELVAVANQWAKREGAQRSLVWVSTKNYPGIEFLQKSGFTFCGYNEMVHSGDIFVFLGMKL